MQIFIAWSFCRFKYFWTSHLLQWMKHWACIHPRNHLFCYSLLPERLLMPVNRLGGTPETVSNKILLPCKVVMASSQFQQGFHGIFTDYYLILLHRGLSNNRGLLVTMRDLADWPTSSLVSLSGIKACLRMRESTSTSYTQVQNYCLSAAQVKSPLAVLSSVHYCRSSQFSFKWCPSKESPWAEKFMLKIRIPMTASHRCPTWTGIAEAAIPSSWKPVRFLRK